VRETLADVPRFLTPVEDLLPSLPIPLRPRQEQYICLNINQFGVKALHTEKRKPTRSRTEIAALRLDLFAKKPEGDQALAFIVERIRNSTRATAAAIALLENGEIVCRASNGNAPSVGARVDPNSGFSGECVRTGEIVRCDDTESDPRADRLVCRSLDLRSIVIVPVRIQGRPAGILEVFSSQPNAFDNSHERVLKQIAELVAEIAERQSKPGLPRSAQKVSAALMKPVPPEPKVDDKTPAFPKEIPPTAIEIQAAASPAIVPATKLIEKVEDISAKPQREALAVETVEEATPVSIVQPPAAAPKEIPPEAEPAPFLASVTTPHRIEQLLGSASARLAALASAAAPRLSPLRMRIAAAGIVVTVLLVAGGWQHWRAITPPKIAPLDTHLTQAQPAANAPARLLAVKTTTAPVKPDAAPAQPKPAKRAPSITLPPPDITKSVVPPVIALGAHPAGEASPISNLLAAPVAAPRLDIPVSQTSGGKLITKVDPIYPSSMALGVHGEVVLKATINRKGQVTKVRVVRGQVMLARAAVVAVTRWRYEPFLLNGVPIEVENDIVINFKGPGQ